MKSKAKATKQSSQAVTQKKRLRLHSHPHMEEELKVPQGHVIIDSDVFLELVNIHGSYVNPNMENSLAGDFALRQDSGVDAFCGKTACKGECLKGTRLPLR